MALNHSTQQLKHHRNSSAFNRNHNGFCGSLVICWVELVGFYLADGNQLEQH